MCVQVSHHKDIGKTIEEFRRMAGVYTPIKWLVVISGLAIICCSRKT